MCALLIALFALLIFLTLLFAYFWGRVKITKPLCNAHSLGMFEGRKHLNLRECFLESYKNGYRHFEVDVIPTSDGKFVCMHDWTKYAYDLLEIDFDPENPVMSEERFLKTRVLSKSGLKDIYPMGLADLVALARECEDAFFMVDFHNVNLNISKDPEVSVKTMEDFVGRFLELGKDCVSRFIFEVYSIANVAVLVRFGIKNIMWGVDWKTPRAGDLVTTQEHLDAFSKNGIRAISYGIGFVLNNLDELSSFQRAGLTIYSCGWEKDSNLLDAYAKKIDFLTSSTITPRNIKGLLLRRLMKVCLKEARYFVLKSAGLSSYRAKFEKNHALLTKVLSNLHESIRKE